jgi:hypothetical protein
MKSRLLRRLFYVLKRRSFSVFSLVLFPFVFVEKQNRSYGYAWVFRLDKIKMFFVKIPEKLRRLSIFEHARKDNNFRFRVSVYSVDC